MQCRRGPQVLEQLAVPTKTGLTFRSGAAGLLLARTPFQITLRYFNIHQATSKRFVFCRYTVGKVPKAFKIIPVLSNWEEVLYLTEPEKWSAHAVYQATRLFISNLNAKMVRRRGLPGKSPSMLRLHLQGCMAFHLDCHWQNGDQEGFSCVAPTHAVSSGSMPNDAPCLLVSPEAPSLLFSPIRVSRLGWPGMHVLTCIAAVRC